MIKRDLYQTVEKRLLSSRQFVQVLIGPRQVGKTTLSRQLMALFQDSVHYASADTATLASGAWLTQQWLIAREMAQSSLHKAGTLLVLDEIQKITQWSDWVKRYWDEDTLAKRNIKVLLLGSTPLLLQRGLSESLAFYLLCIGHMLK